MLQNIEPTLINQEILAEQIKALESGYIETIINLIKWPVFIEACEKDLETANEEKTEALIKTLAQHKKNQETNELAIIQLNHIIKEARNFLTK